MNRFVALCISITTLCVGAALAGYGVGRSPDMSRMGMTLLVIGTALGCTYAVITAVVKTNRPADVAFDDGYQMGYDKGWTEGRRDSSLNVVDFKRSARG